MMGFVIYYRIARFLRQSFRQSIRRFRGESVDSPQPVPSSNANLRGRQARSKINPEFTSPPDYATVIIGKCQTLNSARWRLVLKTVKNR